MTGEVGEGRGIQGAAYMRSGGERGHYVNNLPILKLTYFIANFVFICAMSNFIFHSLT